MANPFKQGFPQQPNVAPIRNMMAMMNPQTALNTLIQQNPQMAQVMQLVNGRDPKQVFYELCKQRNVDPESILSKLR